MLTTWYYCFHLNGGDGRDAGEGEASEGGAGVAPKSSCCSLENFDFESWGFREEHFRRMKNVLKSVKNVF